MMSTTFCHLVSISSEMVSRTSHAFIFSLLYLADNSPLATRPMIGRRLIADIKTAVSKYAVNGSWTDIKSGAHVMILGDDGTYYHTWKNKLTGWK